MCKGLAIIADKLLHELRDDLRQPRGTQSEREPLDKPHHSCYAGLFKEIL